jgi:hypothetical protein
VPRANGKRAYIATKDAAWAILTGFSTCLTGFSTCLTGFSTCLTGFSTCLTAVATDSPFV